MKNSYRNSQPALKTALALALAPLQLALALLSLLLLPVVKMCNDRKSMNEKKPMQTHDLTQQ